MGMVFRQRCFFPFRDGAPSIHSLRVNPSKTKVLVTTDRNVQQLGFDAESGQYRWDFVAFPDEPTDQVDVIASGVIACPGRERVVVAYAEVGDTNDTQPSEAAVDNEEKLFLNVIDPRTVLVSNDNGPPSVKRKPTLTKKHSIDGEAELSQQDESRYTVRFELVAAPTLITSIRAKSSTMEFHGVILFRMESMVAIGFVDDTTGGNEPSSACVRLSNDQFASFFPEFAEFKHPVLTVDVIELKTEGRGWIAMGCADGFIRVFSGRILDGVLGGPYEFRETYVEGPVMSVSLFATKSDGRFVCNLVAACAIGQAVVFEDFFGQKQGEPVKKQMLPGSDQYETIYSALAADIDLDGETELLIGTDDQSLLAYKLEPRVEVDTPSAPSTRSWTLLPRETWEMRAFGGIFSLAWLDLNDDGVNELIIASSTGVYVYEADPVVVVKRVEALVAAALKA